MKEEYESKKNFHQCLFLKYTYIHSKACLNVTGKNLVERKKLKTWSKRS